MYEQIKVLKAVITADIIDSSSLSASEMTLILDKVKYEMSKWESTHYNRFWVQRGDSFQAVIDDPTLGFETAMLIRSVINLAIPTTSNVSMPRADIRFAIGIDEVTFERNIVSESSGPAFYRSGKSLDEIKKSSTRLFKVSTGDTRYDEEFAVTSALASSLITRWSVASSEVYYWFLKGKTTQQLIADEIGISQSSVQRRMDAMDFDAVAVFNSRFKTIIKRLTHALDG